MTSLRKTFLVCARGLAYTRGFACAMGLLAILSLTTGDALAENGHQVHPVPGPLSFLDEHLVVPQEWAGIWQSNFTVYDCDSGFELFSDAQLDTLCTGTPFIVDGDDDIEFICTGTVDATSVDIECSGSTIVGPDCTMEMVWTTVGTRDGDTMTSTTTLTMTQVGSGCEGPTVFCTRMETTGTRIGSEPEECGFAPVDVTDWSTIKGLYR